MKRFLAFVKKEWIHIFRDMRTLLILFGIPASQILIFGYVVSMDIKDVKIAILDLSKDNVTKKITQKIVSSEFFQLHKNLESYGDIEKILRKGAVREVIVFESSFAEKMGKNKSPSVQLITDGSEPNSARLAANYTRAIIQDYLNKEFPAAAALTKIKPNIRMYYNPTLMDAFMFVPGVMTLILMLICALMTSVTITREKEFGTMEILLVSPLKPGHIILGKVIPYLFLSFVNVIIILIMAYFVFGLPISGSVLLLLAESILFISLALSLGILISTIAHNMQQAMFISLIGLLLPCILLSGFIFPIENMPLFYQYISLLIPPRWFIVIVKNIMIKGTGVEYVWKETLILGCMTLFFLIVSIKKFRIRL
ncbi:MAG: ABC transporter permease [Chitinispirillia bacterium]|jgi:ABC-2 type transport system permease protein